MDNREQNTPTLAVASVNIRGTFVIPAEIKKTADIGPGCRLLVFGHKHVLSFMKLGQLHSLMCSHSETEEHEE